MSPWKPKKPCRTPGCKELTSTAHCAQHTPTAHEPSALPRGSSSARGYGRAHQRWRLFILARDPLCVRCLKENPPRTTPSTEAHHVDGDNRNLAAENGEGLCKSHHSRETSTSRRAFGGKPAAAL